MEEIIRISQDNMTHFVQMRTRWHLYKYPTIYSHIHNTPTFLAFHAWSVNPHFLAVLKKKIGQSLLRFFLIGVYKSFLLLLGPPSLSTLASFFPYSLPYHTYISGDPIFHPSLLHSSRSLIFLSLPHSVYPHTLPCHPLVDTVWQTW